MKSITISFEENGLLKIDPKGLELTKHKVVDMLGIAFSGACKGYGLDMVECSDIITPIICNTYYSEHRINEKLKELRGEN